MPQQEKKSPEKADEAKNKLGEFTLLRLIGKGGMGAVYEASRPGDLKKYAVKILLPSLLSNPEIVARFEREIKAGMTLDHPAIVRIHHFGEDKGKRFFAMDFVEGIPIDDVISGKGMTPKQAAAVIGTAAEALQTAHQKGITHRDVKPGNLILSKEGKVFITDFGIAKEESSANLTADGQVIGTPFYMSPEQAMGRKRDIGPASDVYSLGITLYEALTRTTPFRGEQFFEIFRKILNTDPLPPSEVVPGIPVDLDMIVMKAIRKEPSRRYATAQDFADDLKRFLAGEPVHARPMTGAEIAFRAIRRHKGLLATAGAALLILVGFVAFLISGSAAARRERDEKEARRIADIADSLKSGRKLLKESRFDDARKAFEKVVALDEKNAEARRRLNQVAQAARSAAEYRAESERAAMAAGFVSGAQSAARKALDLGAERRAGHAAWLSFADRHGPFHQSSSANQSWLKWRDSRHRAMSAAEEAMGLYVKALAISPQNEHARQGIAALAMLDCAEAFEAALRSDDQGEFEDMAQIVEQNDVRGEHAPKLAQMRAVLSAECQVAVSSVPPADESLVCRFDLSFGTRAEIKGQGAGRFRLTPGSYVAVFTRQGYAETRIPFTVERPRDDAGSTRVTRIEARLMPAAQKYQGMVFVQGGEFRMGGDGVRAGQLRTETVPDFFIDRSEVTCAGYARFLAAVAATDRTLAAKYRPVFQVHASVMTREAVLDAWAKARTDPPRHEDWNVAWKLEENGAWTPLPGWEDKPVGGVTYEAAEQYARSIGKRLPSSVEWEKAARGVDGRRYPWGDRFDESRAATIRHPSVEGVSGGWGAIFAASAMHEGESPYGCLHMAGNLAEWTSTDFTSGHKVNRGGCAFDEAEMMRCSSIDYTRMEDNNSALGFRCARDPD